MTESYVIIVYVLFNAPLNKYSAVSKVCRSVYIYLFI